MSTARQVSGHDFSRAVKAQKRFLPCAAGPRAAKRSAKNKPSEARRAHIPVRDASGSNHPLNCVKPSVSTALLYGRKKEALFPIEQYLSLIPGILAGTYGQQHTPNRAETTCSRRIESTTATGPHCLRSGPGIRGWRDSSHAECMPAASVRTGK